MYLKNEKNHEFYEKAAIEIKVCIANFLLDNGGMSNGYSTYAEGTLTENVFGRLEWMGGHDYEKLTLVQIYNKGREFYNQVYKIMQKHKLNQVIIMKREMHGTEAEGGSSTGCYDTLVVIPEVYDVHLLSFSIKRSK